MIHSSICKQGVAQALQVFVHTASGEGMGKGERGEKKKAVALTVHY